MTKPISPEVLAHYGVLGMKWGVRKDGKPQGYQGPGKDTTIAKKHNARVVDRVERASQMRRAKSDYKITQDKQAYKQRQADIRTESGRKLSDAAGGGKKAYLHSVGRGAVRNAAAFYSTQLAAGIATKLGVPNSIANNGALAVQGILKAKSTVKLGREIRDIKTFRKNESGTKKTVSEKVEKPKPTNAHQERKQQRENQNKYMEVHNRIADKINSDNINLISKHNDKVDALLKVEGVKSVDDLSKSGLSKLQNIHDDHYDSVNKLVNDYLDSVDKLVDDEFKKMS